jgi:hypothetical protein
MSAPYLGIVACTCSALTFNARLDRSTIKHASQIPALATMMVAAQTAKTPTL